MGRQASGTGDGATKRKAAVGCFRPDCSGNVCYRSLFHLQERRTKG